MFDRHRTARRRLLTALDALDTGLRRHDLAAARAAIGAIERWIPAVRPEYEAIARSPGGRERAQDPVFTAAIGLLGDVTWELLVTDSAALAAGMRVTRRLAADAFAEPGATAAFLSSLGNVVLKHATDAGDRRLVDEAIAFGRMAADVTAADPLVHTVARSMLAEALQQRHRHGHDVAALDEAITVYRAALDTAHQEGSAARPLCLAGLAGCLEDRYDVDAEVAWLDEAVDARARAVELVADDRAALPGYLQKLGAALTRRYAATGLPADIEKAAAAFKAAVAATPGGDAAYPGRLSDLAAALAAAYRSGVGDRTDLTDAVEALRRAVHACSAADPARTLYMSNLGGALTDLYLADKDGALLREAVELQRRSLARDSSRADDVRDRPRRLSSLAGALRLYHLRFTDPAALDEAISCLGEALDALPDGHPQRPGCLSNLGLALGDRFHAPGGTTGHLTEAITALRTAAELLPDRHPDRPSVQNNLAELLQERHRLTSIDSIVEHAKDWTTRRALQEQGGEIPAHLAGLSPDPPFDLADADQAVRLARAALDAVPPEHPDRRRRSVALGLALCSRFTYEQLSDFADVARIRSAMESDRAEAMAILASAAADPRADPQLRALAGAESGHLAAYAKDWAAAADGYRVAVEMLPRLVPRRLRRDDQEYELRDWPGLACDAAAVLLRGGGDPLEALTVLEQGRGVLLRQAMDLDGPAGLRDRPDALAAVAADGPVVAVNLSDYGCDALMWTTGGVLAVRLPDLTAEDVAVRAAAFRTALDIATAPGSAGFAAEDRWTAARLLDGTLAWLWDTIAGPVLEALDITGSPASGAEPRRLWWIPTGMLSFLPLHAAGHHAANDGRTVLDRVVSSYAPALRALTHLRSGAVADDGPADPLVIAVSQAGGHNELPSARREADLIHRHFPHSRVLAGQGARRAEVLAALSTSEWVHFACHADSSLDDPSASCLLLADGPLTVREIGRHRTPRAHLAYLSACATGRGGTDLIDEAIHISSAFQLAGYPHVIATLWPIADDTAVGFADDVYATLAAAPGTDPARAVHAATRRLRDSEGHHNPASWAAYVHTGP